MSHEYLKYLIVVKYLAYFPGGLKKDETKALVSHIKLEKKKDYKNGDKVGDNYIYLGDKLMHIEPIYAKKNKGLFRW